MDAIGEKGKYFEAIGPLVKFQISLMREVIRRTSSPILMVSPDFKKIFDSIGDIMFFKVYDRFEIEDAKFSVERARELTKTEHDKMDLHAATRIPSFLWWLISGLSKTDEDRKVADQIQDYLNGLDEIHGMNPKLQPGPEVIEG